MRTSAQQKGRETIKELLKLKKNKRMPLLMIDLSYFNHDFHDELISLLEGLERLPIQIVVSHAFHGSLKKHLDRAVICPEDLSEDLIRGSTMCLFLSDDEHMRVAIKRAFEHGCVPICYKFKRYESVLKDYDPVSEQGNCFLFKEFNTWDIFAAVVRAVENARFSWDWQGIVREGYEASVRL